MRTLGITRAHAPVRAAADDLCSQPSNSCDPDGRLNKLSLVGSDFGNLICPLGFPKQFAGFQALRTLDLSNNRMIGGGGGGCSGQLFSFGATLSLPL